MTNDRRPHALALDMGGTQMRAALFEDATLLRRASTGTDLTGGPSGILEQFDALLGEVGEGISTDTIAGIGVSSAGPVDTADGVILGIPTIPGLEGFRIREALAARTGHRVFVENDAICAARGEWQRGAGQGLDHLLYLTVSSGIGGGAVVDGRLLHGHRGMATHIGHMRLALDGPRCPCGALGCFEALASGTALARRATEAAATHPTGYLGTLAQSAPVSSRHVFEGARTGDVQCLSLVEDEARFLGQGIVSLIQIFSPELVVMGGGLANAFDLLEPGIHSTIRADAVGPFKHIKVVRSALGDNSGLMGAAAMVFAEASAKDERD